MGYADTKISAMTSTTTMNAGDVIPLVANPSGSATNNIITKTNLAATLDVLTQSSGTATYLQKSSASVTYLNVNQGLTQSSATATYLQLSSASATYLNTANAVSTYLTQSSATATYFNPLQILPVASGGTGTASPVITAGTNITSVTGTWPNVTINAATQGGGGGSGAIVNSGSTNNVAYYSVNSSTTLSAYSNMNLWASSVAVTSTGGLAVTYGVVAGSVAASSITAAGQITAGTYQGAGLTSCGSTSQAVSWTSGSYGCTTITAAGIGALTGNQTITLSGDSTGSGATSIAVTNAAQQPNITTFTSSITVTNRLGENVTYGVIAGSVSVSSLTAAGQITGTTIVDTGLTASNYVLTSAAKALVSQSGVPTTDLTGALQAAQEPAHTGDVTNSAGSLAMTAAAQQANITTFTSSLTVVNRLGANVTYGVIAGSVTASSMTASGAFVANSVQVNNLTASNYVLTSAAKLLTSQSGIPTTDLTGALQAAQFPALTGDITTSAGALATTAAAQQNNITSFGSSVTFTNTSGINAKFAVFVGTVPTVVGSATGQTTTAQLEVISTSAVTNILSLSTAPTGVLLVSVSSIPATLASDFVLTVSSSDGTMMFGVQNNGHVISSGTVIPVLTSCGTGPAVTGTDFSFTITGGTAAGGCTATFGSPFVSDPTCTVTEQTMSLVNAFTYTHSATAVTITQTGLGTGKVDVHCIGNKK